MKDSKQLTKELLEELVSIPSVFPNEEQISIRLEQKLCALGLRVKKVPSSEKRVNLVAWYGEHENYLGLYAHMDTVPPALDYDRDPFQIEWEGTKAKGLGTADMKGGMTCILRAAEIIRSENLPVKVIFGVDEENISLGANDLAKSTILSDVDFIISAEAAQIVNPEERITSVYGRKGRVALDVVVMGAAAHAAEPHKGKNAILEGARFIQALQKLEFPNHHSLGPTALLVESVHAEATAYSVPERCQLRLSVLTTPGSDSPNCIFRLESLAKELNIEVSVSVHPRSTPYSDAYEIDLHNPFLKTIQREILEPLEITAQYSGSVADENVFARELNIPVLCLGAKGAGIHQSNEWLDFNSLLALIEIYQRCMRLYSDFSKS